MKLVLSIVKRRVYALYSYIYDFRRHMKYSMHYKMNSTKEIGTLRNSILLLNHQLEKAQTYENMKHGYGREKVIKLIEFLEIYIEKHGIDDYVRNAIGVLNSHIKNSYSWKNQNIIEKIKRFQHNIENSHLYGGITEFDKKQLDSIISFDDFLKSRRSCRVFSDTPVSDSDLRNAIGLAMTSPSACNRQTIRVHIYDDKDIMKEIIYAQESDIDWCLRADKLLIITSDEYYYRDFHERNQKMFDAGLFAMTLNLALHDMKIGACFKMAQKFPRIDINTKRIAKIPNHEDICVLLLIGNYPDRTFSVAKSTRLSIDTILKNH